MNKYYLVIDHNWNQLQRYKSLESFLKEIQSLIPKENFEILYYYPAQTNVYKVFVDKYGVLLNFFYHQSGAPKFELPTLIQITDSFAGKFSAYEIQIKSDVFGAIRANLKEQFPTPVIILDPPPDSTGSTGGSSKLLMYAGLGLAALIVFYKKSR